MENVTRNFNRFARSRAFLASDLAEEPRGSRARRHYRRALTRAERNLGRAIVRAALTGTY